MKFVLFYPSLVSDWDNANAHFLRGIVSELIALGHAVEVYEPADGWSRQHLVAERGETAIAAFHKRFPKLHSHSYALASLDFARVLEHADVVMAHASSDPELVAQLGRARRDGGGFQLLLHDTDHRSATAPQELAAYALADFDGVLAFGESVRQRYLMHGWHDHVCTWHEAADTRVFHPRARVTRSSQLAWVGNWGDGERARELREYLVEPMQALRLRGVVHGVGYPPEAIAELRGAGIGYRGWVANWRVPTVYSRARLTLHIPRQPYVEALPGIPTIRVFEALACGIPLICAPWSDREGLFEPGRDFLVVHNGAQMREALRGVLGDPVFAATLAENGLQRIRARHTCAHRVTELFTILATLRDGNVVAPRFEVRRA